VQFLLDRREALFVRLGLRCPVTFIAGGVSLGPPGAEGYHG
jgi:hypothetical protein